MSKPLLPAVLSSSRRYYCHGVCSIHLNYTTRRRNEIISILPLTSKLSPGVDHSGLGHRSNHLACWIQPPNRRAFFGTWPKVRPKRIRVITMDVTGTLVSFRGTLEDHYLGAARKCGVDIDITTEIDSNRDCDNGNSTNSSTNGIKNGVESLSLRFSHSFGIAYKETSRKYPCFGADAMTAKEWWKVCVLRSFELAGANMSSEQQEMVFQRIYSTFGSHAAYEVFPDSLPFLRWAQRHKIVCGILSNADERYGDSILPMLGLTPDELQFLCFSKDFGLEKPDGRFFATALERSKPWLFSDDELLPSQVMHIGNDFTKDFEGAMRAGMHAVLLERYDQSDLMVEWKRRGAQVFHDLVDVVEYIGRNGCKLR